MRARQIVASLVVSQELSVVKDSDCPRPDCGGLFDSFRCFWKLRLESSVIPR